MANIVHIKSVILYTILELLLTSNSVDSHSYDVYFFTASQMQPDYQQPQQIRYHDISSNNLRRVNFNQRLFEPYNRVYTTTVNNRQGFHQSTGNLFNQPQIQNFYNPLNQHVNKQNYQYDNLGQPQAVFNVEQQPRQKSVQLPLNGQIFNLNRNNESLEVKKVNELQIPNNNCTVTSNVNSTRPRIEGLPIDDEDCEGDIGNRINPNALKSLIG